MKLSQLMNHLAMGELSNLAVSENGKITQESEEQVRFFIEETLNKIYGELRIKTSSVYLEMVEGKASYEISAKHLMEPGKGPDWEHYLYKPSGAVLDDDILSILAVEDYEGVNIPINIDIPGAVFTTSYNTLQIPYPVPGKPLEIKYTPKHPALKIEEDTEIDIASPLVPAVKAYVAYLLHNNINTEVAVTNAQKYLLQYRSVMEASVTSGIIYEPESESNFKFSDRGFI